MLPCKMQHWQDCEVMELLLIRGRDEIRTQITGTVKDTAIYNNISRMLRERGIVRTPRQIINKLKSLKKKYLAINDQKTRSGVGHVNWPFYDLCHHIYGVPALDNPVKLSGSLATCSSAALSPSSCSPSTSVEEDCEIERDAEGEARAEVTALDADETTEVLIESGPVEEEELEPARPNSLLSCGYSGPTKRRKRTVMDHATTVIANAMAELKEMDRVAAERDEARMQMFMEHERTLWERQERIMREEREYQRSLFELLLSRLPGPAPQ